jgi:hypothetical protein
MISWTEFYVWWISYDLHKGENILNFRMFPFNMCTSNHILARNVLVPIVLEVNKNVKDEINWRNIILPY